MDVETQPEGRDLKAEYLEEMANWWAELRGDGYCHVKVTEEPGFSDDQVKAYFESKFDPSEPHLIVRHRAGEKPHFHVQGVLLEGVTRATLHKQTEHPAKKRLKKPFQCKKEHFEHADKDGFKYMLKPVEWDNNKRVYDDFIIHTSFDTDQILWISRLSLEFYNAKKNTLPIILKKVDQVACPQTYYHSLKWAAYDHLVATSTSLNPTHVRNIVIHFMWSTGYKPYKAYIVEQL